MRKLLTLGVVVAMAAALVAPVVQASPAAAAGTTTTVVLTFDDGVRISRSRRPLLQAHDMDGDVLREQPLHRDDRHLSHLVATHADAGRGPRDRRAHASRTRTSRHSRHGQAQAEVCQDRFDVA